MSGPVAFYCVSGRDFFCGAVALLNSLRLQGHDDPMYVLDCGLAAEQRRALEAHATVVAAPSALAPSLLKLVAPTRHPAELRVLLDADLIVTRPLTELLERAQRGRLVGFRNDVERHFDAWSELPGLPPVRPGPYLTTSVLAFDRAVGERLIPATETALEGLEAERTWLGEGAESDPLYYADQDVINAVVNSVLGPGELDALPAALAPIPPFDGVRVADEATLRCTGPAGEPFALHHAFRKPWLERVRTNPYSRLLTRVLLADDVALRLSPEQLPRRLRPDASGRAERFFTDLALVPPGIARRLTRRRPRVTAWPNDAR